VEGLVGLIQLATSAASARLLKEPATREYLARGYVVSYVGDERVAKLATAQFTSRMTEITTSYQKLSVSLEVLQQHAKYTAREVQGITWEKARDMHAPRDCLAFDEIRSQIEVCLCHCAIMHAQIVSSVTTIIENIRHSYICGPQEPGPMGHAPWYMAQPAAMQSGAAEATQPQEETAEPQSEEPDERQIGRRGRRSAS
jgi:hypothetical protein